MARVRDALRAAQVEVDGDAVRLRLVRVRIRVRVRVSVRVRLAHPNPNPTANANPTPNADQLGRGEQRRWLVAAEVRDLVRVRGGVRARDRGEGR